MSSDVAIEVEGVAKRYRIGATQGVARYRSLREDLAGVATRRAKAREEREFWALQDVSFQVRAGETVGVIGRNGAGKSTLLKILAGITPPTRGSGRTRGRVGSLLEVGTGFHPELTGRENVQLAGAIMGMRRTEVAARFDDIVEFAGVTTFLDTPVKRYSSGMYMRLAFSVAAHLEPEILLVDEVLAVGDVEFQRRCLGKMEGLSGSGRTVLFVSHSMPSILRLCPRVILLDGARLTADGPSSQVVQEYLGHEGGSATLAFEDFDDAPGDDVVRLRSIRILDGSGAPAPELSIGEGFTVETEYWNRSPDPDLRPSVNLHFFDGQGTCLFTTWDENDQAWRDRDRTAALVRTRCHVPGHFLAEGPLYITAGISSLRPTTVHVKVDDAVATSIVDPEDGAGVRSSWVGDWPGAVRPMLPWSAEEIG